MTKGGKKKTCFDASQAGSSVNVNTQKYLRGSKTSWERYFERSLFFMFSGVCPSMLVAATALSDFGKVPAISLITLFVSSLAQELTLY